MLDTCSTQDWVKYQCPFCKYLLHDAVQISCGHWLCLECAEQLFARSKPRCPNQECAELLAKANGPSFFADRFIRKAIARLDVLCANKKNGCNWKGKACDVYNHLQTCKFIRWSCKYCGDCTMLDEKEVHLQSCPEVEVSCPLSVFGCRQTAKMTRSRLVGEHLAGNGLLHHIEIMARCMKEKATVSKYEQEIESLRSELLEKDQLLASITNRIIALEKALQLNSSENEDRDYRLSLIENSSFDGTIVWKITDFHQRIEDARTGKYNSIFSLPFFSGRYGYKMCLRMFPLGDGSGKGTHVSLFFVVMKGEYDDALQWPFTYTVTFKLINLAGGRDLTEKIKPDPHSNSFQKPTSDMNVATGSPRFVDHKQLFSGGFVVGGNVLIKAIVDTSNMKHP